MSGRPNLNRCALLTGLASLMLAVPAFAYESPIGTPTAAPAYVGEKIVIPPTTTSPKKEYVGHVTLIRREASPFVGNPATGGWTGRGIYDLFAEVTSDDGLTYTPAQALDIPIDFEFSPVIPPSDPDIVAYKVRPKIQKLIILFTDGNESRQIRETPGAPAIGDFFTSSQGPYQVSSFFDVFFDVSIDAGATWESAAPLRLTAVPEPTGLAAVAFACALLGRRRR